MAASRKTKVNGFDKLYLALFNGLICFSRNSET